VSQESTPKSAWNSHGTTRRKKCDEGRPRCERCVRGGFECLGYEHHRRAQLSTPGSDSPSSNAPSQPVGSGDTDMTEGLFATPLDGDLSTPGAGPSSGTTQATSLSMQTAFSGLPSAAGDLPSPTGTGLTGLQNFLESLGPSPPNDIALDGLMSTNGFDGTDLFGGFGNMLGFGMSPAPSFNTQPTTYAHIEPTDAEPRPTAPTQSSEAAFNELGAELIASHQTVARPHEGLLLADDEEDDIDPEGLLAEVERSMRLIKLDGGEHLSELYDFCERICLLYRLRSLISLKT
jgi:hypothetical protein